MLGRVAMQIKIVPESDDVDFADYVFRLDPNASDTGFWLGTLCDPREDGTIVWFRSEGTEYYSIVRCTLGKATGGNVVLSYRRPAGDVTGVDIATAHMAQAKHLGNPPASYQFDLDTLEGEKPDYVEDDFSYKELTETTVKASGLRWNSFANAVESNPRSSGETDVVVKGFWYGGNLDKCGHAFARACVAGISGAHLSDLTMWFSYPPAGKMGENITFWTTDFERAQDDPTSYYMTQIAMHEWGHVFGMGHSDKSGEPSIMQAGYEEGYPVIVTSPNDRHGVREVLKSHDH